MKSKRENIAEYILYLWQIEDYLRAFPEQAEATEELRDLNAMMHEEGLMEKGHLQIAKNALSELEELHEELLTTEAYLLFLLMLSLISSLYLWGKTKICE